MNFHKTLFIFLVAAVAGRVSGAGDLFISGIELDSITYRNGVLAWKTDCGGGSTFLRTRIQRIPSGGGTSTLVYHPVGCPDTRVFSQNVALDEEYDNFWTSGGGDVLHLPSSAVTATLPDTLTAMETPAAYPPAVSAGDSFVFWTETLGEFLDQGKIFRVLKTGGARELVFNTTELGAGAVGLEALTDNAIVFLLSNNRLVYAEQGFGWVDESISTRATAFTIGNGRVYFAARAAAGTAMEIRSASLDNPTVSTLHHTISGTGSPQVYDITVDAANVYWHELRSGMGPLVRKSLTGGVAEPITASILGTRPIHLKSDGRRLFWMETGTAIRTLAVGAAAVTFDLAATGMEVVQAIQSTANDVPSVMGKPTFVRLFGELVGSSSGATEVSGWPMAVLHGEVDGTALPGSPLMPLGHAGPEPVFDRPFDRTALSEGFMFRLPRSWTMQGPITLRGVLNPNEVVRESDFANNTTTLVRDFLRKSPICVIIHPLRTHQGIVGSFSPEMQPYFDLAEVMLPTSELRMFWPGGSPMEEYEFPFSSGPYELSEGGDVDFILFKLWLRNTFGDDPDECDDMNAATHRAALFISFAGQAVNGQASAQDTLVAQLNLGGTGINNPIGAITFAHELGHNYDREHVNCPMGDPDDPDPGYPYGCNISSGPMSHLGFHPLRQTMILDSDAGDLMSYAHRLPTPKPRWPSDYTWKGIQRAIGNLPAGLSPAMATTMHLAEVAPGMQAIVGAVVHSGGTVEMFPATQLVDGRATSRAVNSLMRPGDDLTYQLRAFGSDGLLLRTIPVKAFKVHDGGEAMLLAIMDEDPAIARVDLVRSAAPAVLLGRLKGGGGVPRVSIIQPTAGEIVGETLTVRWTGNDPEGEILRYTVRYSNDDGVSWHVLQEDSARTELFISTTGLAGGSNCRIQVLGSDGLLTGWAISELFTVKTKAPKAQIFFETQRGKLYGLNEITIGAGQDVILHGQAYDDEDGPLSDQNLFWTIAGRLALNGTGKELLLRDLPPGTYNITLLARDSSQAAGQAHAKVIAEPKFIAQAQTPVLNGYSDDPGYFMDHNPLHLRYASGEIALVRAVHGADGLYVCVSGMPVGTNPRQWVGIVLDVNNSNHGLPQSDDLRLVVFADGRVARERGNGSSFSPDSAPLGFRARVARNGGTWNAEFRIDDAVLGGWSGQTIGMDVAHYHRNFSGDDTHWLAGAGWNVPSTWGDVTLRPDSADPFDGDKDGMADQWELLYFQTLQRNGAGNADQDAHTDSTEYQAGTNPLNSKSILKVERIQKLGNSVRLTWQGAEDRVYSIWQSSDLSAFMPIRTGIVGQAGLQSIDLPLGNGPAFFRLEATLAR